MPASLTPDAEKVIGDFLQAHGADATEIRFALEALTPAGRTRRRELRLMRLFMAAIARIAREPWSGDDLNRVLDFAEAALVPALGMAAPQWHELRQLSRLRAGGHTNHCAHRLVMTGDCTCELADPAKVGRLPREATVRGHVETRHTEIAEPEPEPCPTCTDGECAIHPSTFRAARRCEQVLEGPNGWRMRCDRVGGHEGPCRPGIL